MTGNRWLLGALVLAVLLAGCSGGSGTTTVTATDAGADQQPPTTSAGANADGVVPSTVDALEAVDRYRVEGTVEQTLRSNEVTQNVTIESSGLVARDARRSYANLTRTARGQSIELERYILDDWIYEHQDAYAQRFGSAWVKQSIGENFSVTWRNNDEVGILRAVLENGSVRLNGTDAVDGRETRVLDVDANGTALETYLLGRNVSSFALSNVTTRVWVDADTSRPLRVVRKLDKTQTAQGRTIHYDMTVQATFEYRVDERVELPPPARNATDIGNGSSTG